MGINGFGEHEIKCKIKNIRSTYSQEIKKIKQSKVSGAGTDGVNIPSIKWFNLLDESIRSITPILTDSTCNLVTESTSNLPGEHSSGTHTESEENDTAKDTVFESHQKSAPARRKRKIAQLSSMVSQLKEISETASSTAEENEFDIFCKHVGIQLRSLPLVLALDAQEHIQLYINRIRRQHLAASEADRFSTVPTPLSSCDSQGSIYVSEYSPDLTGVQSSSIMIPSDIIITAMNNSNDDYQT